MHVLQNSIIRSAINPQAIKDDAVFVTNVIDLFEFEGCDEIVFIGNVGATDIALAALIVKESDTKTDDNTLGGTPTTVKDASVKPSATDDGKCFAIHLDLRRPRERYVQLQATAGDGSTGTYLAAIAIGSNPHAAAATAAGRGLIFADHA